MRATQRKHLMGGSLKTAMADEIKRVLANVGGHRVNAANELGISVRTLEKWLKSWDELKDVTGSIETVLAVAKTKAPAKKKKAKVKAKTKKKAKASAEARVA